MVGQTDISSFRHVPTFLGLNDRDASLKIFYLYSLKTIAQNQMNGIKNI